MAAITRVFTTARAAMMLGITEDLLDRIVDTMEPEDGVLWIYDSTNDGTRGLTPFGIENVREVLDDPERLNYFLEQTP